MATVPTDITAGRRRPDCAAALRAVDAVEVSLGEGLLSLTATKTVGLGDRYMDGHFPGFTVYPGVFVLETVAQAAAAALGEPVELAGVRSMRFTAPLLAGDTLTVQATVAPGGAPGTWAIDASCRRADGAQAARIKLDLRRLEPADA